MGLPNCSRTFAYYSQASDAARVERAHRDLEAVALGAEARARGHEHVLEADLARDGATQAHLVLDVAEVEAVGQRVGDDEGREALVALARPRHHDEVARLV